MCNILHLGEVHAEMRRVDCDEWHTGTRVRVARPATSPAKQPVRLMDTGCGHDLVSAKAVAEKGCYALPVSTSLA